MNIVQELDLSTAGGHGNILDKVTMVNTHEIDEYLAILKDFPFVDDVYPETSTSKTLFTGPDTQINGILFIRTHGIPVKFIFTIKNFTKYAALNHFIHNLEINGIQKDLFILFADYVSPPIGEFLDKQNINFIDKAGNYRFVLGENIHYFRTCMPPYRNGDSPRSISHHGLLIILAMLIRPEIIRMPLRDIAVLAGTTKSTAANWLNNLENEGLLGHNKNGRVILKKRSLLSRWIEGYPTIVLPQLFIGTYMTPYVNPVERDQQLGRKLSDLNLEWAKGGLSASWELVKHYRGEMSTFHVSHLDWHLLNDFKIIPSKEGHLTLLSFVGNLAMRSELPHIVHPLLVYTQLLHSDDSRAQEAAASILEKYLQDIING